MPRVGSEFLSSPPRPGQHNLVASEEAVQRFVFSKFLGDSSSVDKQFQEDFVAHLITKRITYGQLHSNAVEEWLAFNANYDQQQQRQAAAASESGGAEHTFLAPRLYATPLLHQYEHYAGLPNADVWARLLAPIMHSPAVRDVIAKAKSAFHATVRGLGCCARCAGCEHDPQTMNTDLVNYCPRSPPAEP